MANVKISKLISHALRHEPEKYGLKLDPDGWVYIDDLLLGLRNALGENFTISKTDVESIINFSDKKRHEIVGNKIRSKYGHSIQISLDIESTIPPRNLYHGTKIQNYNNIKLQGLKRMRREFVHLSSEVDQAKKVAERRKGKTIILIIDTQRAVEFGVNFFSREDVWLCKHIPADYISLLSLK
jgi:putative RNA 2'-phosphotransferase